MTEKKWCGCTFIECLSPWFSVITMSLKDACFTKNYNHNIRFMRGSSGFLVRSRLNLHVVRGVQTLQTTNLWLCVGKCLPHHWQSVDTLQDLSWKEMQFRLWKILAFSPGGKSTLTNIELYIWSVINSTWNGGPRWQSRTPVLLIAPAVPVNKYFPFSLSLRLFLYSLCPPPPPRCLEGEVPLIISAAD